MYIERVEVWNFRSLKYANVKLTSFVVFVGQNDVGKSNILKALNLFFNQETEVGMPFNFVNDFAKDHKTSLKKAKEVVIKVIFSPPSSYKGHEKKVVWTKRWRESGLQSGKETLRTADNRSIPQNSKMESWVRNLKFQYVPAIKDDNHFGKLLATLYDTLYTNINEDLIIAGDNFIKNIRSHTTELTKELSDKLNFQSAIQLPSDLSGLFSTLDFETDIASSKVPLKSRGDGIKSKHIPIILKFISKKSNMHYTRGSVMRNTIWGYEEPENSLEFARAIELADHFKEYSKDIQILVTTHSPVFYSLAKNDVGISTYFVNKDDSGITTDFQQIDDEKFDIIDKELGMLTFLEPHVKNYRDQISSYEAILAEIKKDDLPVVFVEGETDAMILSTAWAKLYNTKPMPFKITPAFDCYFIGNMFRRGDIFKNNPKKIFIGLLDFDSAFKEWERVLQLSIKKQDKQVLVYKNFVEEELNGLTLSHSNGRGFLSLLPVPSFRKDYARKDFKDDSVHCIETMFKDELIKDFCVLCELPGNGKVYKIKDSKKKKKFADNVKNFDKKDFDSFKAIFNLINKILSSKN
ncbi:MAG: AAA family ATPase [Ignavibacteriales bacterium]|nr:MAG: AAA family ATPase [Ignavibacteriales bacterium]